MSAGLVFSVAAGIILGMADARAAAVLLLPMIGVVLVTRFADSRIKAYREADRIATGHVTGLVGDMMAAATTVKVNGAAENLLARLERLVKRRGETAVRDRVLSEGVFAFSHGAADVGFGIVLIISASAIADGSFTVGTLALFAAYLGWLSFLPRMVGRLLARRKQAGVAFERMRMLVAETDVNNTVRERYLPIERWQHGVRPDAVRPPRVPLQRFEVVGLSARYADGSGVGPVSFVVERGSFTVVTGPVGAGKSTLLRAMLGLGWRADVTGVVRWNGTPIDDPGAFLVPPNAAFLPQVPQLVSDSVSDNVSLGPMDEDGDRHGVGAGGDLRRGGGDARRRRDADRPAWLAPVRRSAPASGDGSGVGPSPRARRPRRPLQRGRRRDRGAPVGQPRRRRTHRHRRQPPRRRLRARRSDHPFVFGPKAELSARARPRHVRVASASPCRRVHPL